ncbi:hypothetical protein B1748_25200 [Paenibacillus sp. MY03]|uniref:tail fiber domain-containing protein n=1 Tax=Paenibacillus sp. MY03 TaxID=302980 RepID=UPI000B3D1FF7|nr:tail fiber domain-containing protein [Paenibacillus sp. MY03]OUS72157.1 hypothetical protein B1748_25200 [Paenibacillus sp. MY03]
MTIPDNDVVVLQPFTGAIPRTQQDKNAENLSIKDFGGAADGTSNDTTALATTLNAVGAGGVMRQSGRIAYQYGVIPSIDVTVSHSNGAEIGTDERLTNPGFTGGTTGWTLHNFSYGSNSITHTAGTVGAAEQYATIDSYATYILLIEITTTEAGSIAPSLGGSSILDSIPEYYLEVGSQVVNVGCFPIDDGSMLFKLSTDTSWAGTITSISFIKVAKETEPAFLNVSEGDRQINVSTGDSPMRVPNMIKFGPYLSGSVAVGDRLTASCWYNDAAFNVAIGGRAQQFSQHGFQNTAVGAFSLQFNQAHRNSAYGYSALRYNGNGISNTGIGYKACVMNTEGSYNTAVGFHAAFQNTTGHQNTTVGFQAMYNSWTDSYNTAFGSQAGLNCRGGKANTFVGALSGCLNSNVNVTYKYEYTTSVGAESLAHGSETVALGWRSRVGTAETPVSNSVGIGTSVRVEAQSATAVGDAAHIDKHGLRASVIGQGAFSSSDQGVSVGFRATSNAGYTTSIGAQSGTNQMGSYGTFLGFAAGYSATPVSYGNITCLGVGSQVTGSNQLQLGDSSITSYAYGAVQDRSDARDKANIRDTQLGLPFIMKLRPRQFNWDYRQDYVKLNEDGSFTELSKDGSKQRKRFHEGLIAQEVKEVLDGMGVDWGGYQDHTVNGGEDVLSIGYTELIGPLIKAIQELKAEVDALKLNRQ